jgi:hypothetical protein
VEPWLVWLAGACDITEDANNAAPANERKQFFMVTT